MAETQLWASLDGELATIVDTFAKLVKSARITDEEAEQGTLSREARLDRVPSELPAVWAEKLVHAGHAALHQISHLKRGALLNDFQALMNEVRDMRKAFDGEVTAVEPALATIKREAEVMLHDLEASYYSSSHRGKLVVPPLAPDLQELAALCIDVPERQTQSMP